MKKYEGADGIRGLACLVVIIAHAFGAFFSSIGAYLGGSGKVGVWLFFVLSAFLLTARMASAGFSFNSIASYALGRFMRIIPLYIIALLIYRAAGMLGLGSSSDLMDAIFFARGFGHLWTIPVEFKFYLVLPFIAFSLLRVNYRFGGPAAFVFAILMILIEQWLWPYWLTPENSIYTRWYLSSFTIGCYCAIAHSQLRDRVSPRVASILGVLVILAIALMFPTPRNILFGMPIDSWLKDKFVYVSLLWGVFIVVMADGAGLFGRFFKSKVMSTFGAWSFSMYLIHLLFYVWYANAHPNSFVWMILGIASAVGAGGLLYHFVESPIEKYRKIIQNKIFVSGRRLPEGY
ncbi:acyltransferase [Pseudomonas syringae]|nr:acyltransferase [Pseudomonas syringae]MCQ3032863.1 acyltransferase [Pseudomonas syringae]